MSKGVENIQVFLDEANLTWKELLNIMTVLPENEYRINEILYRLMNFCPKLSNAYPIIIRNMVETKQYNSKAAKYYLLWASKQDVQSEAKNTFEKLWKDSETKELSKILIRMYNAGDTTSEVRDVLEYLEDIYGIEDATKIPEDELPKIVVDELNKVREHSISDVILRIQSEIEAKYYVYILEQQERKYHRNVGADAKAHVLSITANKLFDEKKQQKLDQDQRIEKINLRDKKLIKEGKEEEIQDMERWMKNSHNAKLGTKVAEVEDNSTWSLLKDLNF